MSKYRERESGARSVADDLVTGKCDSKKLFLDLSISLCYGTKKREKRTHTNKISLAHLANTLPGRAEAENFALCTLSLYITCFSLGHDEAHLFYGWQLPKFAFMFAPIRITIMFFIANVLIRYADT
jgi:hypothetical protein